MRSVTRIKLDAALDGLLFTGGLISILAGNSLGWIFLSVGLIAAAFDFHALRGRRA